jgi:nitroreductase
MDFFKLIDARHSVRAYRDQPVDPKAMRRIVAAADFAPSAGDLQAYRIVLVESQSTKAVLAEAAHGQDFILSAPVVLVFFADPSRNRAKYGQRGAELFCIQDATIAAAYAQLAAVELGLACCWVGAFREQPVADALGAPQGMRPVAIIPIGHPAEAPQRPPRRAIENLCSRERF